MRDQNWNRLLSEFIAARRKMPHAWGTNDCLSFCADAGVAMGCADFLAPNRGYTDALEAGHRLYEAGFADLRAFLDATLPEIELPLARRGDVALVPNEGKDGVFAYTCALVDGPFLFGPGERKAIQLPRRVAVKTYRLD